MEINSTIASSVIKFHIWGIIFPVDCYSSSVQVSESFLCLAVKNRFQFSTFFYLYIYWSGYLFSAWIPSGILSACTAQPVFLAYQSVCMLLRITLLKTRSFSVCIAECSEIKQSNQTKFTHKYDTEGKGIVGPFPTPWWESLHADTEAKNSCWPIWCKAKKSRVFRLMYGNWQTSSPSLKKNGPDQTAL